jgi:hypothetical protein
MSFSATLKGIYQANQSSTELFLKGNKMIVEKQFTNKPSFVSVNCNVRDAVANGASLIILQWGENQINVERTAYGWCGHGWIGKSNGYDIANNLNKARQSFS